MVRRYRAAPVDAATVDRILDAARCAPSAGFAQGVDLVIVTSEERRRRLATAAGESEYLARGFEPWLSVAPVHIIVACQPDAYRARYSEADKSRSTPPDQWPAPYWWVDAGAMLMLLLLAAEDEGLAAGFLGSHAFDDLAALAGFPDGYEPLGLVTVGHPAPTSRQSERQSRQRPLTEFEHSEAWGTPRRSGPNQ